MGYYDEADETEDGILQLIDDWDYGCFRCKHLHKGSISCQAFSKIIPDIIINGQVIHNKKMFGQKSDIFFEAVEKED
jgi:hypothetical protein